MTSPPRHPKVLFGQRGFCCAGCFSRRRLKPVADTPPTVRFAHLTHGPAKRGGAECEGGQLNHSMANRGAAAHRKRPHNGQRHSQAPARRDPAVARLAGGACSAYLGLERSLRAGPRVRLGGGGALRPGTCGPPPSALMTSRARPPGATWATRSGRGCCTGRGCTPELTPPPRRKRTRLEAERDAATARLQELRRQKMPRPAHHVIFVSAPGSRRARRYLVRR